jgi:FkbM family methyltransferase
MDIQDRNGKVVDTIQNEKEEQDLAKEYIQQNDIVFELGARYGSVSCVINSKLNCKTNQVVVEPDERVWEALEQNKKVNNCEFNIVKGFVSNKKLDLINQSCGYGTKYYGYGTSCTVDDSSKIPSYTLKEIEEKYKLKFNVLVADCEGFLENFFDENPNFYDQLRLIIFEADCPDKCNYIKIKNTLTDKGFTKVKEGFQNVWINFTII